MSRVLVLSGHPDLNKSYTNRLILERLAEQISDIEIRDLPVLYPDSRIDVAAEQEALLKADIIVLQFPFYWYSVPGILKQWQDDVFSYGFAYGSTGDKLKGKKFIISTTIGGPEEAYQADGYNHFTIEQLLYPLRQTAYLAQLDWQTPAVTHGMVFIPGVYNTQELVESRAEAHAQGLIEQIQQLLDPKRTILEDFVARWFAQFDALPEQPGFFLGYLDDKVNWHMPEGQFHGHQGFLDWYAGIRNTIQPDCDHKVSNLVIEHLGDDRYQLQFTADMDAELHSGEALKVRVNESWQVRVSGEQITILDYRVSAQD